MAEGTTSGTTDGGATWFNANDVGRFINRFRFTGTKPIVAYASGGTIYKCVEAAGDALARLTAAPRLREAEIPHAWETLDVKADVPAGAKQLTITVFDPRQTLVKVLADESAPQPGQRNFAWNFKTDDGVDTGFGHFIYRVVHRWKSHQRHGRPPGARRAGRSRHGGPETDPALRPARQTRA